MRAEKLMDHLRIRRASYLSKAMRTILRTIKRHAVLSKETKKETKFRGSGSITTGKTAA